MSHDVFEPHGDGNVVEEHDCWEPSKGGHQPKEDGKAKVPPSGTERASTAPPVRQAVFDQVWDGIQKAERDAAHPNTVVVPPDEVVTIHKMEYYLLKQDREVFYRAIKKVRKALRLEVLREGPANPDEEILELWKAVRKARKALKV